MNGDEGGHERLQIVGLVRDAGIRYARAHPPWLTSPFEQSMTKGAGAHRPATFIVRSASSNPLALARALRQEVSRRGPDSASATSARKRKSTKCTPSVNGCSRCWLCFSQLWRFCWRVSDCMECLTIPCPTAARIGIRLAAPNPSHCTPRDHRSLLHVVIGAAAGLALGIASTRYLEDCSTRSSHRLRHPRASVHDNSGRRSSGRPTAVIRAVRIDQSPCCAPNKLVGHTTTYRHSAVAQGIHPLI